MSAFVFKTRSEQMLDYLEGLERPLTDEESSDLQRAMHAVYQRERKHTIINQHRNEELALLEKLRIEAQQPSALA